MTSRLFIALEIPGEVLEKIISVRDSVYGEDNRVRWEPKDKLHITLKFLGDTDVNLIPAIKNVLKSSAENYTEFGMEFTRFGMFYKEKNPAILWLGTEKSSQLNDLYREMDNGLFSLGFRKENREFKPHLTILRIKGKENFAGLKELTDLPGLALKFNVKKIILFKSTLLKTGSVYEEVESFLLK